MPWLPLLFIPVVVAFIGLISTMLSRMGWGHLAKQYAVSEKPTVATSILMTYFSIGVVSYKNAATAGIAPEGLVLTTWAILFIGHPPLVIPWSAFGPVRGQKFLWSTTYSTTIDCHGEALSVQFSSDRVLEALRPWVTVEECS
ncbi:hypothetical protein [Hymenobacter elongatus]|uniref:Uncharacterized protein n=1 Tax=Hymenobacter elongatus TaxID=877208 RepID=A0A4Z0PNH7_9BACT|nr:hypothetical protein [Hymenobacter elongatus]TGE18367.1 hypothetical protein E5J99_05555 [Hymenobacter elongatus]